MQDWLFGGQQRLAVAVNISRVQGCVGRPSRVRDLHGSSYIVIKSNPPGVCVSVFCNPRLFSEHLSTRELAQVLVHISGLANVIHAHDNPLLEAVDAVTWCHSPRSSNACRQGTMSVRIQFDRPQVHFTNLDFLTGKVIIHLVADAAISAVTVKLEGESRTRLSGPRLTYNNERSDKRRTELEWHKVSKCCLCYFEEPSRC